MGPGWCGGLRLQKNRNVTPTLILNEHCGPEDKAECKGAAFGVADGGRRVRRLVFRLFK